MIFRLRGKVALFFVVGVEHVGEKGLCFDVLRIKNIIEEIYTSIRKGAMSNRPK